MGRGDLMPDEQMTAQMKARMKALGARGRMNQTTTKKPSLMARLFGARRDDHAAVRPLWHRVVALARDKAWYTQGGIADTLDGRFDAITLVLSLVLLRMERAEALKSHTALITELFVTDMDGQLRESGVGDLVVGKQIGQLMSVLGGRLGAYREALAQEGDAALTAAVARNVGLIAGADPAITASLTRALFARLGGLHDDDVLHGELV
jgi:cytochrome b pre-mRNA-processing protein 3